MRCSVRLQLLIENGSRGRIRARIWSRILIRIRRIRRTSMNVISMSIIGISTCTSISISVSIRIRVRISIGRRRSRSRSLSHSI